MVESIKEKLNKIYQSGNFPFICLAILYFVIFSFAPVYGDDSVLMDSYKNLSLADHWELVVYDYNNWSSRVIVNFVIHFILGKGKYPWLILNTLVCYILGTSLSALFVKENNRRCNWFIAFLILLFPIKNFGTAGWMITTMTYFWPISIGIASLVPIKKMIDGKSISIVEKILYSLALIYAANEELMLIILLFVYVVFLIHSWIRYKKINAYHVVQILLLVGSIIFTALCPGNNVRSDREATVRFPNYGMLSTVDKIDIGFSSTCQQLFFGKELFFIVVCAILFIIVYKKYKDWTYRIIAFIPFLFTLALGPLKDFTTSCFDGVEYFTYGLEDTGLFSLNNNGMPAIVKFMLYCLLALCFIDAIILAFGKSDKTIFSLSMLISGTASRVAMGFSPTIYVSGFRTATPMYMCLLAIGIMGISYIEENGILEKKESDIFTLILICITIFMTISCGITVFYH